VSADKDVSICRTQTRDDVPPVVAELLHLDVEADLLELVRDILRGFDGSRLSGAPAREIRTSEKRYVLAEFVYRDCGDGQECNGETGSQQVQSPSHHCIHLLHVTESV
jgi:hypothetical protein